MHINKGDTVRYIGSEGRPDLTKGKCYEVIDVRPDWVAISDDAGEYHSLTIEEVVLVEPIRPKWLQVFQDGDAAPDEGVWAGTTVFDNETQWYCFRVPMDDKLSGEATKGGCHGSIRFINLNGKMNKTPLNPVRAAAMLLAFSEEEEVIE